MRGKGPLKREVVSIVAEIMRMRKCKSLSYSSKTPRQDMLTYMSMTANKADQFGKIKIKSRKYWSCYDIGEGLHITPELSTK